MKLLFLLAAFPLLLFPFGLEKVTSTPPPAVLPTQSLDVGKDEEGVGPSLEELWQQKKPGQDRPWISIYTPLRSCHTNLTEKHGEFSLPSFPDSFQGTIWCNWTVWASSRKHIVIYIKGFRSNESCDVDTDKIFFLGVSSLAENAVIDACEQKEVHVFATYAQGVHVVLLMRQSAHPKTEGLVGKYYIFKHQETKSLPKDIIGSFELLIPELSRSVFTGLPLSEKETVVLQWGSTNTSLSVRHRTDKVTELGKSSPAMREDGRVVDLLPNFVWQAADAEHLTSERASLLSTSLIISAFSFASEMVREMRGFISWGYLQESTAPPDVLPYLPYLSSSPPVKMSSPPEGTSDPSWGSFIKNGLQMSSQSMPLDYQAMAPYSLVVSYILEATAEANNEALCSQFFKEVRPTIFQTSMSVHEAVTRDPRSFESALLFSPEQNRMGTEVREHYTPLPLDTIGRNQPGTQSSSPVAIFSSHVSEGETTMLFYTRPVLENVVHVTDLQKTLLAIPVPTTPLCRRLCLRTRNGFHEAFDTIENELPVATEFLTSSDVSYSAATKLLGESGKVNWEEKSRPVLDITTKLPFSLNEVTTAPIFSSAPELRIFSQEYDLFLRIMATVPFPAMELEPSLSHSSKEIPSFIIQDLEPTFSATDSALYPSMGSAYLFPFIELGQTLSLPEMKSPVLAETTLAFSSATEGMGSISSGLECASSETDAILQTAVDPDTVLGPSGLLLELAVTPTATVNPVVPEQTAAAFSPLHENALSFGLLGANTVKNVISRCWRGVRGSKQEVSPFLTIHSCLMPSQSVSVALVTQELEHLFSTTERSPTKERLLEGGKGDDFVTAPEEKHKRTLSPDVVEYLNSVAESKLLASFDGITTKGQSPQNEAVTVTPLVPVPLASEEKGVMNLAFISSTGLASGVSPTKIQAVFPVNLKSVFGSTGAALRAPTFWEMQPSAEWQQATLEVTVAGLNVPGTRVKDPAQKNDANMQIPLIPSDIESKVASKRLQSKTELGSPWLMVYVPVKSCHITLKGKSGTFSPPNFSSIQTNKWCNWTIWAGPHKHILIYIDGFEGKPDCEENQDKILFQGVISSVENKIAYACKNHKTLIFTAEAVAAHVVFLSKASSQNHGQKDFKGRYYIFEDYEMLTSATGDVVPGEPVLKSNSRIDFPPNSYVIHSRHISDFGKVNRIPSNEHRPPAAGKKKWGNPNNSSSLEALLRPAVSNYTPVSILKASKNVTPRVPGRKNIKIVETSPDQFRTGNDTPSGNLKRTVVLGSDGSEAKEKAAVSSASPYESQRFRMRNSESVAAGIPRESSGLKNNGHVTIHWSPTCAKDATRAKLENPSFHNGLTSPQAIQEWRLPIPPHKNIPEEKQKWVLQPSQSRDEIADKVSDDTEFQQVELKEAAGGERMDSEVTRGGNGDQDVPVVDTVGGNGPRGIESPPVNMANNSTITTKAPPTSSSRRNVSKAFPTQKSVRSDLMGITTASHWQVALPGNLQNTQAETVVPLHPGNSVTRHSGCSQGKCAKSNPPYFQLPEGVSSNKTPLKEGHINNSHDGIWIFASPENDSLLESQHKPGDVLLEVTFSIEHREWIPHNRSDLVEKDFIESVKMQVQERVKFLSNKVKEIKLKEIKRKEGSERKRTSDPNLMFTFWLHLVPEEKNISRLIHSQLESLGGTSMGSGEIRQVSVGDVNECSSGIELCGEQAICLNGYGTYLCQCKEEYEDRSSTKSGTLCVQSPPSGLRLLYSYMEIVVGIMLFFICAIIVVISVLCAIVKKRRRKKDLSFSDMALSRMPAASNSQAATFDQNNIQNLLTLDPARLKLRAKSPEWPLPLQSNPTEVCRVSVEQSECL